jgi:hypothetical protein
VKAPIGACGHKGSGGDWLGHGVLLFCGFGIDRPQAEELNDGRYRCSASFAVLANGDGDADRA